MKIESSILRASSLGSLQNKPLRERIASALREAILTGEFKPGQPLIETELATLLGVSRAPLREALQLLNAEGLVESIAYHGTTVRTLSRTDIEELYSLRIVLETFAAQCVIARRDPAHAQPLRSLYETMLLAAEREDLNSVSEIDRDFHDTLIDLSEHSLLHSTWSAVSMRVRQVMALRNRRNRDIRQIAYNHMPIIEAIERGDLPCVAELLQVHIGSARDLLVEQWEADHREVDK